MRRAHAVLPAHLADHELRVATDEIGPFRTSFAVEIAQVPQQKDQAVILRKIVATDRAVRRLQVPYVADKFLLSDDEGSFHRPLLGELIAGASPVEEA